MQYKYPAQSLTQSSTHGAGNDVGIPSTYYRLCSQSRFSVQKARHRPTRKASTSPECQTTATTDGGSNIQILRICSPVHSSSAAGTDTSIFQDFAPRIRMSGPARRAVQDGVERSVTNKTPPQRDGDTWIGNHDDGQNLRNKKKVEENCV